MTHSLRFALDLRGACNFTPSQSSDGSVSPIYGRPYGIIDTFFRGAYKPDNPIGITMLEEEASSGWFQCLKMP